MRFYDLVAFDEIQTISFSDSKEMQSSLKTYLESGKTTVGHYEFISECGLMLLGNIKLGENGFPVSHNYLEDLPKHFKESALLDRFHGFIEYSSADKHLLSRSSSVHQSPHALHVSHREAHCHVDEGRQSRVGDHCYAFPVASPWFQKYSYGKQHAAWHSC